MGTVRVAMCVAVFLMAATRASGDQGVTGACLEQVCGPSSLATAVDAGRHGVSGMGSGTFPGAVRGVPPAARRAAGTGTDGELAPGGDTLTAGLSSVFAHAVKQRSPWKDAGTVEVMDVRIYGDCPPDPAAMDRVEATFSPGEDFLGLVRGTLSVGHAGKAVRLAASARVRLLARVCVPKRDLRAGTVISGEDIETAVADITREPRVCRDPGELAGKRARVTLRKGAPVVLSHIETRPEVCSGDTVTVVAKAGGVEVEAKGVAVRDARTGQSVKVKNLASGRLVVGTVIAQDLVEVGL